MVETYSISKKDGTQKPFLVEASDLSHAYHIVKDKGLNPDSFYFFPTGFSRLES